MSTWKQNLKRASDTTWKGLHYVGAKVNKLSGKVGAEGFWPQPMALEIEKCSRILRSFTIGQLLETAGAEGDKKKPSKVRVQIPPKFLRNAQGIAIFTVFRTGLGFSAASGSGVVIARNDDNSWGSPSGILVHTIGFGADIYDVVLILRNRKAVMAFSNPKVSIGAELSVAAGPLGAGAMLDTGIEAVPVLSYVKGKGLYGGVQLDGNIIIERNDENARFYGRHIKAKDILAGGINRPADADLLVATIESAEGQHTEPTSSSSPHHITNIRERLSGSVSPPVSETRGVGPGMNKSELGVHDDDAEANHVSGPDSSYIPPPSYPHPSL
ncbi:hypothetical protein BS47DRAFT_1390912 [Hydnum rufescens UP504]|uniref:Ysc84 actin-binding domain-containing protein n=1 Tax=Hydnum rufescens UP504 TaxID=1448309 RepID=A0A9P6DVC8_9AGAM|nr:hypothetical protein BS47DRAFT_1390912 [Hydnum rufescens UP504]